jgi:hypothetical protein
LLKPEIQLLIVLGKQLSVITPAYPCLDQHLNFIAACAEFLPLQSNSFDWVHIAVDARSCAKSRSRADGGPSRLKPTGQLVIRLYVDGGKSGKRTLERQLKEIARTILVACGVTRHKDHHTFHPTFANLCKIITDNRFSLDDVYWQPQ